MRSLLLVPGDDEQLLAAAAVAGADALLVDVAGVAPRRKARARRVLAEWARRLPTPSTLWVAASSLDSGDLIEDLDSVVPLRPAGIVFTGVERPSTFDATCHYLAITEVLHRIEPHSTRIALLYYPTAAGILCMRELARQPRRRIQLLIRDGSRRGLTTWPELEAREHCLSVGRALGVPVVDEGFRGVHERIILRRHAESSVAAGFSAKIALDSEHLEAIHTVFSEGPLLRHLSSNDDRVLRASA